MSYLAWPVSINGKIQTPDGKPFHMTLKYLGKHRDIPLALLASVLSKHDLSPVNFHDAPKWQPVIWEGDDGKNIMS